MLDGCNLVQNIASRYEIGLGYVGEEIRELLFERAHVNPIGQAFATDRSGSASYADLLGHIVAVRLSHAEDIAAA